MERRRGAPESAAGLGPPRFAERAVSGPGQTLPCSGRWRPACPALPCWSELGVPRLDFPSPVVRSCLTRSSEAGRAQPHHTDPSPPVCPPPPVGARWPQLPDLSVKEPGRPPASGSWRTKPSAALDPTVPDLKLYWRRPSPAHREGSQAGRTVRLNPWAGATSRSFHLPPP